MGLVARYDASTIMMSLDGFPIKPSMTGAYVLYNDHAEALQAERDRAERAEKERDQLRAGVKRATTAEAALADARKVIERWQSYGCPDCGGDCASANPPVSCCIMRETHEWLSAHPAKETKG